MSGSEICRELDRQPRGDSRFIKWWRKENDFVDIELLESFRDSVKTKDSIDGYELLDMDQIWQIVTRLCPGRVSRAIVNGHDSIIWDRVDKDGVMRTMRCSFVPEFLMQILDVETHGNYIE